MRLPWTQAAHEERTRSTEFNEVSSFRTSIHSSDVATRVGRFVNREPRTLAMYLFIFGFCTCSSILIICSRDSSHVTSSHHFLLHIVFPPLWIVGAFLDMPTSSGSDPFSMRTEAELEHERLVVGRQLAVQSRGKRLATDLAPKNRRRTLAPSVAFGKPGKRTRGREQSRGLGDEVVVRSA